MQPRNIEPFFLVILPVMQQLRYLILSHTLIHLPFIFISSCTPNLSPLRLVLPISLFAIIRFSFQGSSKAGFARVIYFLLGD